MTRQQLTGKEGCDAEEWIFKNQSYLLVELPSLKDLCRGHMGGL